MAQSDPTRTDPSRLRPKRGRESMAAMVATVATSLVHSLPVMGKYKNEKTNN